MLKEPTTTPFQNKLPTYLEQTQNRDPDKQFLLSLLPDYKKLNDTQKFEYRINTLQFLKNAHDLTNNSLVYAQSSVPQNNVYSPYPSAFHLPTQKQIQNNQCYPNNTPHISINSYFTDSNSSTQNSYPTLTHLNICNINQIYYLIVH